MGGNFTSWELCCSWQITSKQQSKLEFIRQIEVRSSLLLVDRPPVLPAGAHWFGWLARGGGKLKEGGQALSLSLSPMSGARPGSVTLLRLPPSGGSFPPSLPPSLPPVRPRFPRQPEPVESSIRFGEEEVTVMAMKMVSRPF